MRGIPQMQPMNVVEVALTPLTKQLFHLRLLNGDSHCTCATPTTECVDDDVTSARGIWAETHELPGGVVFEALQTADSVYCQFWTQKQVIHNLCCNCDVTTMMNSTAIYSSFLSYQ